MLGFCHTLEFLGLDRAFEINESSQAPCPCIMNTVPCKLLRIPAAVYGVFPFGIGTLDFGQPAPLFFDVSARAQLLVLTCRVNKLSQLEDVPLPMLT